MGEFFRFTAAFGEHYHSYFKDKYTEGAFVLDASFLKEFNASAGDVRKVIVALKENKAPVHTRILSDILSAALDDELEGRGLEYKGKPIRGHKRPKTAAELGTIFDYRLALISEIINMNADVRLQRQELFNLQNHMHSLRQIATAFQVGRGICTGDPSTC